jgi:hypothetical protein
VSQAPPRIVRCTNSTITEAWAVAVGLPGPVEDADAPLIMRRARQPFAGLKERPAIVAVSGSKELAAPFWSQQVGWDNDRYLARFGHRYLSVHFVKQQPEERYDTFATTLQPQVTAWLEIVADALGSAAATYAIDRVAFGYTNQFSFPAEGFDISRYFKLTIGFDIGPSATGLLGLATSFRVYDAARNLYLIVELAAEGPTSERPGATVTTKVVAERRGLESISFADRASVADLLIGSKEGAKATFFEFATEETHALMGAVRDATG